MQHHFTTNSLKVEFIATTALTLLSAVIMPEVIPSVLGCYVLGLSFKLLLNFAVQHNCLSTKKALFVSDLGTHFTTVIVEHFLANEHLKNYGFSKPWLKSLGIILGSMHKGVLASIRFPFESNETPQREWEIIDDGHLAFLDETIKNTCSDLTYCPSLPLRVFSGFVKECFKRHLEFQPQSFLDSAAKSFYKGLSFSWCNDISINALGGISNIPKFYLICIASTTSNLCNKLYKISKHTEQDVCINMST